MAEGQTIPSREPGREAPRVPPVEKRIPKKEKESKIGPKPSFDLADKRRKVDQARKDKVYSDVIILDEQFLIDNDIDMLARIYREKASPKHEYGSYSPKTEEILRSAPKINPKATIKLKG